MCGPGCYLIPLGPQINKLICPYKNVVFMIFIISGPPRAGKTYFTTRMINKLLKEAKKKKDSGKPYRRVFSNFPVFTPWGSSLIWKPELVNEEIVDSDIFIDEAYQFYNSRNFKNFTTNDHLFFALNGHNSNNIYLIAHSPSRLDTVIREMVNEFIFVKKVSIPFINLPLWFRVETFLDELAISQRYITKHACYNVEHYLFKKSIANTYNTQFFRKEGENLPFSSWSDVPEYEGTLLLSEEFRKTPAAVFYLKVLYFKLMLIFRSIKVLYYKLMLKLLTVIKFFSPAFRKISYAAAPYLKKIVSKVPYLEVLYQKFEAIPGEKINGLLRKYVSIIILAVILSRLF